MEGTNRGCERDKLLADRRQEREISIVPYSVSLDATSDRLFFFGRGRHPRFSRLALQTQRFAPVFSWKPIRNRHREYKNKSETENRESAVRPSFTRISCEDVPRPHSEFTWRIPRRRYVYAGTSSNPCNIIAPRSHEERGMGERGDGLKKNRHQVNRRERRGAKFLINPIN